MFIFILIIVIVIFTIAAVSSQLRENEKMKNRARLDRRNRLLKREPEKCSQDTLQVEPEISKPRKTFVTQQERMREFKPSVVSVEKESHTFSIEQDQIPILPQTVYHTLSGNANEPAESTVFNSPVKGLAYRGDEAIKAAKKLERWDYLYLEREPNNQYDENAIKVKTEDGVFIGYVDKQFAEVFSRHFDEYENSVVTKVVKKDIPFIYMDSWFKSDFWEKGFECYNIDAHVYECEELGQTYDNAFALKNTNPQKAVDILLKVASKKKKIENKITCYHQACMCYRKMKDYLNERKTVSYILNDLQGGLTEEKKSFFERRLNTIQRLEKKESE